MSIASTISPPYYAVIFTSELKVEDKGYYEMAERMEVLAVEQPGFLGIESARDNLGITVSYWDSLEAIQLWKNNVEHTAAQQKGKANWYKKYKVRIAKVERDYGFETAML